MPGGSTRTAGSTDRPGTANSRRASTPATNSDSINLAALVLACDAALGIRLVKVDLSSSTRYLLAVTTNMIGDPAMDSRASLTPLDQGQQTAAPRILVRDIQRLTSHQRLVAHYR
jgi:hypothetical protein